MNITGVVASQRTDRRPVAGAGTVPHGPRRTVLLVWLLAAAAALVPLVWVPLARGLGVSDGTLTYPSLPVWSAGGVAVTGTIAGVGPLRVGDCVTSVGGVPIADLASGRRKLAARDTGVGAVLAYGVLRPADGTLRRSCRGDPTVVMVRLRRYPLQAAVRQHLGGLPLLVTMLAVASFVLSRRPRDPAARALFVAGAAAPVSITTWPLGNQVIDLAAGPGSWPWLWPFVVGEAAAVLGWGALLQFAFSFPRPPGWLSRHGGWVAAMYAVPFTVHAVSVAVAVPRATDQLEGLGVVAGLSRWSGPVMPFMLVAVFAVQFRRAADPADRVRMRWVLYGFGVCAFFYVVLGQVPTLIIGHPVIGLDWEPLIFLPFPLALGAAVLRYSLFDIEVIVRRWLVYLAVALAGAAAYTAGVLLIDRLLAGRHPVATVVLAGLLVLRLQPALSAARSRLARVVFGARDDPGEVLTLLADQLGAGRGPATALPAIAAIVTDTLRLTYVSIEITLPDGQVETTTTGSLDGSPLSVYPLHHQGGLIGQLVISAGPSREPFGPADHRLVDPLLAHIAVAAHQVGLHRQLQRSLERVVTVREEERRRLRRDIHDGLGPTLAAGTLRLEAVQGLLGKSPERADQLIGEVIDLQHRVIADMRALVDGLRPPVLDQLGLVAALRHLLDTLAAGPLETPDAPPRSRAGLTPAASSSTPQLALQAPEWVELPAAVEVAAYRVVAEAVTNALRHARATRITVRLVPEDGMLTVQVQDDGVGLPTGGGPAARTGVGLASIRERVEEVGGTAAILPVPHGGTLVEVALPLHE